MLISLRPDPVLLVRLDPDLGQFNLDLQPCLGSSGSRCLVGCEINSTFFSRIFFLVIHARNKELTIQEPSHHGTVYIGGKGSREKKFF